MRRVVWAVDVEVREARLAHLRVVTSTSSAGLTGQALDGKAIRGAGAHGRTIHRLSLVSHHGLVHGQVAVAAKANEITAAPALLAGRNLQGIVITTDALLTQSALAQQIREQGGDYLMVVKANQPDMHRASADQFADPRWLPHEQASEYGRHQTIEKGHGRLETRTLETCTTLRGWLRWPDAAQVCRRTCRRVIIATGEIQEAVHYAVTSLPPERASPAAVERLWRGHWAIENNVHHVRDVTLGEDAGQAYRGSTPQSLAALRNALLTLLRTQGWTQLADAVRHYGAAVTRALELIGLPASGL